MLRRKRGREKSRSKQVHNVHIFSNIDGKRSIFRSESGITYSRHCPYHAGRAVKSDDAYIRRSSSITAADCHLNRVAGVKRYDSIIHHTYRLSDSGLCRKSRHLRQSSRVQPHNSIFKNSGVGCR